MPDAHAPRVSVVVPVRNEAARLEDAVGSILTQRYPGEVEVILALAPSTDGTEAVAHALTHRFSEVRIVPNPTGTTPAGLNRAIEGSTGDIIARVDAHAALSPGYLETAVAVLAETGAWNVGGIQQAVGESAMERAIAAAMTSRLGTGDARFHYGGPAGPTDTVYLGVWPREVLLKLGGFDETLLRNQDYELNVRIRAAGGQVWFDPRLYATYRPRSSLRDLASQYWQYGRWKRRVIRKYPGSLRWRQFAPPCALVANTIGILAAPLLPWTLLIPGTYLTAVVVGSVLAGGGDAALTLRLPVVLATMHHAWGAGFLAGDPRPSGAS